MSKKIDELWLKGINLLKQKDSQLAELIENDYRRQQNQLMLIAASSIADPSVMVCEGNSLMNVTTEGYPSARFHAGCEYVDEIEQLAIDRAKKLFNAQYANVQPHSAASANIAILFGLLDPNDTILGLSLDSGGHLTHGSKVSITSKYLNAITYHVDENYYLDYEQISDIAKKHRPKLIICGASAYPREIDFKRFRDIANEVGAYLLADISHIAALVAGGMHVSPIDQAHFTTTSTYKQLYGPRGGLILMGKDHDQLEPDGEKLSSKIQKAVFPQTQGTPNMAAIAAKARAFEIISNISFKHIAKRIVKNAKIIADEFMNKNYKVLSGGTDNHMVLIDIYESLGITGIVSEKSLEECNIIINKNKIFGDKKSAKITSGIRLGTNTVALQNMSKTEMILIVDLIHQVLSQVKMTSEKSYHLNEDVKKSVRAEISKLCEKFPIPTY